MSKPMPMRPSCWEKLLLGTAVLASLGTPIVIRAQEAMEWQTRAGGKMAFDVASVKPSNGAFVPPNLPFDPSDDDYGATNGRLTANDTLAEYIEFAYKVWGTEVQSREFSKLAKWVNTDLYTIEARAATSNPTKDQVRLMMQALLADRFQLKAHFETREIPVFELRLAKAGQLGPRLIPHADAPPCDKPGMSPAAEVPDFHFACHAFPFLDLGTRIILGSRDVSIGLLAGTLSGILGGSLAFGRPIIDKTGLSGRFDFVLEFARERRTPAGSDSAVVPDPTAPAAFEALRDQLGLKLESAKAAIPILEIDKVERPSEN